jgi:hypothetical protein
VHWPLFVLADADPQPKATAAATATKAVQSLKTLQVHMATTQADRACPFCCILTGRPAMMSLMSA